MQRSRLHSDWPWRKYPSGDGNGKTFCRFRNRLHLLLRVAIQTSPRVFKVGLCIEVASSNLYVATVLTIKLGHEVSVPPVITLIVPRVSTLLWNNSLQSVKNYHITFNLLLYFRVQKLLYYEIYIWEYWLQFDHFQSVIISRWFHYTVKPLLD